MTCGMELKNETQVESGGERKTENKNKQNKNQDPKSFIFCRCCSRERHPDPSSPVTKKKV